MTKEEIRAFNAGVESSINKIEEFSNIYVERWGSNKDAKAAGWAILQAAVELRFLFKPELDATASHPNN